MDSLDTFQIARQALARTEMSLMQVSRKSGVAYGTLRTIKEGRGNPTIKTLRAVIQSCQEAGE